MNHLQFTFGLLVTLLTLSSYFLFHEIKFNREHIRILISRNSELINEKNKLQTQYQFELNENKILHEQKHMYIHILNSSKSFDEIHNKIHEYRTAIKNNNR